MGQDLPTVMPGWVFNIQYCKCMRSIEDHCHVNSSSCRMSTPVAEGIVSPVFNSCHSYILFERMTPCVFLICLVRVLNCSPVSQWLDLVCMLCCSLLKGQLNLNLCTISLFILPPVSPLFSFSCSDSSMFVSCSCNESKAPYSRFSNTPSQFHLSNLPGHLSDPLLLWACCIFPGVITALWYCRNYINFSCKKCCMCWMNLKWNW